MPPTQLSGTYRGLARDVELVLRLDIPRAGQRGPHEADAPFRGRGFPTNAAKESAQEDESQGDRLDHLEGRGAAHPVRRKALTRGGGLYYHVKPRAT